MLVTFTTDSYPNITMFGEDALAMLKIMGHSATVPGAFSAEDIPGALRKLTQAIHKSNGELQNEVETNEDGEKKVTLAHRGMPLQNLLYSAMNAHGYVMWNQSTSLS
jgi:hypothetical protein